VQVSFIGDYKKKILISKIITFSIRYKNI